MMTREEDKKTARMIMVAMLVISILLTSVTFIGEYNNYETQRQPILTAGNWVYNARTTYNINTSVYDLEQARNALNGTHGNPVWITQTSATQWSAIKTQLNGTIQEGKYLAGHQGNVSGLSYQLAYRQYDASLHTLHNAINNNYQWIALSPLFTVLTIASIFFFIIDFIVFGMYWNDADFDLIGTGNMFYLWAWVPVFIVTMVIYA